MWLFNAFPKDKVQAKYGFAPDQAWLDHVRLSSARAPNGSSSFVSADGLIFTNHHIAQECIHDLSTNGKDYMKNGFYAPTRAEEPKCPGVEFIVLEDIQDVTAKVNAAVKPGMSTADAGKAQREEMSSLEKECSTGAYAAMWSPCIRAPCTTSTSTRSTTIFAWSLPPNSTWRSSAAIPTTSNIPATIWIFRSSAPMKTESRPRSTIT